MSYVKQDESGGGGDTYTLRAAQSGSDVDIQLDATTGTDSDVKLKAGTNITLTEASDTVTIDAAGVAGSIGADQVAFGDPSNVGQIKGSNNFKFVESTDTVGIGTAPDSGIERLHVKGTGLTDMVVFEGTTEGSGSTDGPDLVLYNSATPTGPNKFIGRLEFRGKDDAGAALPYSTIQTFIQDETAGSEDGLMLFKTQTNSAALEKMRLDKDGVILNQTGAALDFRVAGDTKSNLLKVDGGLDEIGIGSAPTSGQGILQVDGDVNFKGLIKVNNASGTAGQVLTSQGPSADPIWAAAGGGGGGGMLPPGIPTGNTDTGDETMGLINGLMSGVGGTPNTRQWSNAFTRIRPHVFSRTAAISTARFAVNSAPTGAVSQVITFGIYNTNANGQPTSLKCKATQQVAVGSSSAIYTPAWVAEAGQDLNVTAGERYWCGFYSSYGSAATSMNFYFVGGSQINTIYYDMDTTPQMITVGYSTTGNPFPDPFSGLGPTAGDNGGATWPLWQVVY